jgi:hypothetical protein
MMLCGVVWCADEMSMANALTVVVSGWWYRDVDL